MARWTAEARQKLSEAMLGDKNSQWKADKVCITGLHKWVRQRLPKPQKCQMCFLKPPYDLANVTGKYTRELSNWKYLCRRCHMKFDGRLLERGPKGRFVSPKNIRVYSPLRRKLKFSVSPNIFVSPSPDK